MDCTGQSRRGNKAIGINMSELEKTKYNAIDNLKKLCARCSQDLEHNCRIGELINQIRGLSGIPVIVNDKLRHLVFN